VCPNYTQNICELAGIEPEDIHCTSDNRCLGNDWEWCKVYISQFFSCTETYS
jgi:hypothetical protein